MHRLLLLAALAPQGDEDVVLPDTTITAPRSRDTVTTSAAKTVVVTGEELVRTGETSLPRAIERATGVWLQQTNLGGGAPVIGGLMGNQILIVVDGVRLNDSTTRFGPNQSLNTIDPYIVDRVEVIRGVRSLLYGSDAIGGVVLIWTKQRRPLSRDPEAGGEAFGGGAETTYDTTTGFVGSLTGSFATEDHGLLAIGSLHDYDDLQSADGTVPNTGYTGQDLFGAWEWATGRYQTMRITGRVHRDYNVPRTDRMNAGFGQTQPQDEKYFFTLQDRRAWQLTYDDHEPGGFVDEWQLRLSFRTYEEKRDRQSNGSTTLRQERDEVETAGIGVDWVKYLGQDAHRLTWGVDFDHDDVDSTRVDTDQTDGSQTPKDGTFAPDSKYNSAGVFVQDEVLSLAPWYMTLGVRYSYYDFSFRDRATDDEVDGDFDALVGSLELARDLGEDYLVTAGLSQGFRAPNLDDLGNDASFAGGTEIGNPDLDPERSWTADLTFAADKPTWGATAGVWYTEIDDYIGRVLTDEGDPNQTGDETYLRENTGEAEIWGVEATLRLQLLQATSPWSFVTRVAYARGQQFDPSVDPDTGEMPLYDVPFRRIPPLHGRAGVRWDAREVQQYADWAELYVLWAAEQDRLNPNDISDPRIDPNGTAGWVTLNADVGGPLGSPKTRWNLGLHNILDQSYRVHSSGFDAPGIALVFGLRANF
jgi:outer membrane receptor protein involved in Fe transport